MRVGRTPFFRRRPISSIIELKVHFARFWPATVAVILGVSARAEEPVPPPCPVVNVREISFAWEASPEEAEAVYAVHVYQTRDGRAWEKVHSQEAARRVIAVTVPDDGWYGFAVVASGAGGEEDPPEPGAAPEIEVEVDTRGPEVAFLGPDAGSAWDAAKPLPLRWHAEDPCGVREVLIEYRQEGADAWRPVRRESRPSGEWLWVVPDLLKPRFDVRVTATDTAGNRSAPQERGFRLRTPPAGVPVTLKGPALSIERDISLSVELEEGGWEEADRIELWQTVDSGKTWTRRGEVFRRGAETLTIRLEETGRYGFFVRPVPAGEETLASLDPGVLPHLECWAKFEPPAVTVKRQDPPSEAARERARRHYLAAQAALARRDTDAARESLAEAMKVWPDFAPAANDLACLEIGAGRHAEAQLLLERIVALEPEDADYRFNLGVSLMAQKKFLEALGHLEKGVEGTSTRKAEARLVLAECLAELGDREKALALCRALVAAGDPARIAVQAQRLLQRLEEAEKR